MAGKIIIDRKNAILKEGKKEKIISVEDLLKPVSKEASATSLVTPVLPEGTRYFQQNYNRKIVIVEKQSRVRTITARKKDWSWNYFREHQEKLILAFPFVVFVFCFVKNNGRDIYLFYRTKPLQSLNDELLMTNLTHVNNSEGRVCLGNFPNDYYGPDIQKAVILSIHHFWNSPFDSLGENQRKAAYDNGFYYNFGINAHLDKRIKNLKAWEEASKINPNFVLNVPWKNTGLTPRKIIDTFLREIQDETRRGEVIKSAGQIANIIYECDEV